MLSDRVAEAALEPLHERVALLDEPHVRTLSAWVRELREAYGRVPWFDPFDGGVDARVLILLETPGTRGEEPRFVSRDSRTGTARNLRRASADGGLDRRDTVLWNAVPWIIHAPAARNRAPRRGEVREGLGLLSPLLERLPNLRHVILSGRIAGEAEDVVAGSAPTSPGITRVPHPSPVYINTRPELYGRLRDGFAEAAAALAKGS